MQGDDEHDHEEGLHVVVRPVRTGGPDRSRIERNGDSRRGIRLEIAIHGEQVGCGDGRSGRPLDGLKGMAVSGQFALQQRDVLRAPRFSHRAGRQAGAIALMDGHIALKVGQCEIRLSIAAIKCPKQREEGGILRDGQDLTVTCRVTTRREISREHFDFGKERRGHGIDEASVLTWENPKQRDDETDRHKRHHVVVRLIASARWGNFLPSRLDQCPGRRRINLRASCGRGQPDTRGRIGRCTPPNVDGVDVRRQLDRGERHGFRACQLSNDEAASLMNGNAALQIRKGESFLTVPAIGGPDEVKERVVLRDRHELPAAKCPAVRGKISPKHANLTDEGL